MKKEIKTEVILRNRLRNLLFKRIDDDFDDDSPVYILSTIIREEASGADIEYCYGNTCKKVYDMVREMKRVIDHSDNPYEDPVVHATLAKYEYYISPSGRHVYGAGPKEKFR